MPCHRRRRIHWLQFRPLSSERPAVRSFRLHCGPRIVPFPLRVVNLDALTYAGSLSNLAGLDHDGWYTFVHGDIGDAVLVKRILEEHAVDAIVNFAAESHVDRSITGPAAFIRTNILGTFTLLEAAREVWAGRFRLLPVPSRFDRRGVWNAGSD